MPSTERSSSIGFARLADSEAAAAWVPSRAIYEWQRARSLSRLLRPLSRPVAFAPRARAHARLGVHPAQAFRVHHVDLNRTAIQRGKRSRRGADLLGSLDPCSVGATFDIRSARLFRRVFELSRRELTGGAIESASPRQPSRPTLIRAKRDRKRRRNLYSV